MNHTKLEAASFMASLKEVEGQDITLKDIYKKLIARNKKNRCCLYFDEDGKMQDYDYERYDHLIRHLAPHIAGAFKDLAPGDLVALKIRNSPNWPLVFWAVLMAGFNLLLIDAKLPKENTENLLRQSGAKALIANEVEVYPVPSFRLNMLKAADGVDIADRIWGNEVTFCSSGTTGEAKMMVYNGYNIAQQLLAANDMPKETGNIMHPGRINIFCMIPFHHIFGFVAVFLWYTWFGKTFVYPNSAGIKDLLTAIKKAPVTHLYSVPMFWDSVAQNVLRQASLSGEKKKEIVRKIICYNTHEMGREEAGIASWGLVKRKFQNQVLGTAIEYCISGGGYLSEKTARIINGLGYPLYNGYGMTEIGVTSVELSSNVEDRLKNSIGHPLYGVDYKIAPLSNSKDGQGELYVKSNYLHFEEIIGGIRQKASLDEEGYYHTGDIAMKDEDNRYYIKGRLKDTIINSNGENVYPDEIELYFKDIKHVVNNVVVGVKKGDHEVITLVLELDNSVNNEDIKKVKEDVDKINGTLANEKKIEEVYIYKKALPIANNMKVKRFVLKDALTKGDLTDFIGFGDERKPVSFEGFDKKLAEEVLSRIRKIFSEVLLLPEFKIDDEAIWNTDLGGDSMSYVSMVHDIDQAFEINIPDEKYGVLGSVKDFAYEVLTILGNKKAA
ncbi:MAG: AMP-binding protein [Bacilli bacterium]|nr:AMP-binding protein [Bacilli bacterium]